MLSVRQFSFVPDSLDSDEDEDAEAPGAVTLSCTGSSSSPTVQAVQAAASSPRAPSASSAAGGLYPTTAGHNKRPCLRPNYGVTMWSVEEDTVLAAAVGTEGNANWVGVAAWLEGRTAQDCLVRWRYSVDPSIHRGKWTPEEDELLRQGVALHGAAQWAHWVPGLMNGRTGPQCRERWVHSLDPVHPGCDPMHPGANLYASRLRTANLCIQVG